MRGKSRGRHLLRALGLSVALLLGVTACGDSGDGTTGATPPPGTEGIPSTTSIQSTTTTVAPTTADDGSGSSDSSTPADNAEDTETSVPGWADQVFAQLGDADGLLIVEYGQTEREPYLLDLDASTALEVRRLIVDNGEVELGDTDGLAFDISPDLTQLAVAVFSRGDSDHVLMVVDIDDGATRILASHSVASGDRFQCPSWSPDGTRVAFAAQGGDGATDIHTVEVESGSVTRLTHSDGTGGPGGLAVAWCPSWLADGTILYHHDRGDWVVPYLMEADGSDPRPIDPGFAYQVPSPWQQFHRWATPSASGRWIAIPGDNYASGSVALFDRDTSEFSHFVSVDSDPFDEASEPPLRFERPVQWLGNAGVLAFGRPDPHTEPFDRGLYLIDREDGSHEVIYSGDEDVWPVVHRGIGESG